MSFSTAYKEVEGVDELLGRVARPGPSFFQLRYFVVGKEPTSQAKMHRCLEEIKQRHNSVKSAESEIEELKDVMRLYEIDVERREVDTNCCGEEREIRIRQIRRKIDSTRRQVESLTERVDAWWEEIKFLKRLYDQVAEQVPLRSWDDFEVQLEYWSEKMSQELRQRVIMNVPVDIEVIKTVLALPDVAPIKRQLLEYVQEQENKQLAAKG